MVNSINYEMKWYLWIGWFYHIFIQTFAYPATSIDTSALENHQIWNYQFRYILGSLVTIALMLLSVFTCLCCRRQRRVSKGFQEFKDGSTAVSETIIEQGLSCLELEVPRCRSNNSVEFEVLPVERFASETRLPGKPKPPSPSLFDHQFEEGNSDKNLNPNREWFSPELHISREHLKYLREIGRGWFGKVVEGSQNLNEKFPKTRGIVVRILTEEATASEKAWFLGEALPYLKLHHKNMLELLGACLETDPYLLLFESCPNGDLKSFLQANQTSDVLIKENILLKMSLDVASALGHMHNNGFAHTDLSARNCLVSSNLSAKLGDYGIGVEKYPGDYYVVGDRALPIRWSAPESLVCTDTTIETRAITPNANLWSFAILLYEIASWGERPYHSLGDEQVIEMILSLNFESHIKLESLKYSPSKNIIDAIKSCWKININDRADLHEVMKILKGKELTDFEERWENLRPNTKEINNIKSTSLNDMHESTNSSIDLWQHVVGVEKASSSTLQAHFRLGPEEPIINNENIQESGSETEEESWRGRVERGAYTEKVKQKSKSIADLMVLVHIDSDSEAEWSLGPQINDKPPRKKLPSSGSVGDLPSMVVDEFDEALRKLRDPIITNNINNNINNNNNNNNINNNYSNSSNNSERLKNLTKEFTIIKQGDENYRPDLTSTPKLSSEKCQNEASNTFFDVELWKNALEFELERKTQAFESINFEEIIESCTSVPDLLAISSSAPDTPQSREEGDISVDNEDFYSNSEEIETERRKPVMVAVVVPDEEDDRKLLSTPDDERSSDSGFRDKESCEEEDNNTIYHSSTEEEQLKILYELDTILDAECSVLSIEDDSSSSSRPSNCLKISTEDISTESLSQPTQLILPEKEEQNTSEIITTPTINNVDRNNLDDVKENDQPKVVNDPAIHTKITDNDNVAHHDDNDNEDDDSSTMSLRSDNSYVSFNLDEEFVAAIRNELREKLPMAQMAVVESQELRDDDDDRSSNSNLQELETNSWTSNEEDEQENLERTGGTIDIAIRYNLYGTPLSPILEERESAATSELVSREDSTKDDDPSVTSKLSEFSEDIIVVDTKTNKVLLVEGSCDHHKNNDESCGDLSEDEESIDYPGHNFSNKSHIQKHNKTSTCAPLPSPEEESKWQAQFPIPLQLQDDLMSTSFSTDHQWDSQDEEDEEEDEAARTEEDGRGVDEDRAEVEDEENSSSSGEFVWKRYSEESNREDLERAQNDLDEKINEEDEDDEDEEEFTPSAWDATLAPHRSALRSPEKTLKTGDQKKNVWFKKQRYHCVYEYPKEISAPDCPQSPASTTWEPTSYADWEEMLDEPPRLDIYPLDYDETNQLGDEEFFVSSGNRPFQFQAGGGKYVSQFFPGANVELTCSNDVDGQIDNNQQVQLGGLRHTRDKLKLNLSLNQAADANSIIQRPTEQSNEEQASSESSPSKDDQSLRSIMRSPQMSPEDGPSKKSLEDELDMSKTDATHHPKSYGRPLIISTIKKNDNEHCEDSVSNEREEYQNVMMPSNVATITEASNTINQA